MSKRRAEAGDAVVGRNIRLHRLDRKMSQTELGSAIGVTFQQVQKYEKGTNRVGAARLVKIATALDVSVGTLLAGMDTTKGKGAASPSALIAERQPLRLVQAFAAIEDKELRRTLMMLTEGIARVVAPRRT